MRSGWLKAYFFGCVGLVLFACGVAVGTYHIFPYDFLQRLAAAGIDVIRYPKQYAHLVPQKQLSPVRHAGDANSGKYVAGKAYPGVTFITGFFHDGVGMRLLDMEGNILHAWHVSFNHIWPDAPHLRRQPADWDTQIHGAVLYPNGDIVFNFQYGGLVRIDRCSHTKWKLPRRTHHSIFVDSAGNLWVPGRKLRQHRVAKYPRVPAPFQEEFILKVSPDGRVLREISVLDVIFKSKYEGVLFGSGAHDTVLRKPLDNDFTHLNDIEVLSPALAAAFPMFEAGDLLVSLRNLDLLMVVDADTERIKWSRTGPYLRQHDPDFLANGRISVFDNRRIRKDSDALGASRILEIDPASGPVITLYGEADGQQFYTETMGSQQILPNGDILITESDAGHAFETTRDGEVVWSYVNRWDEGHVALTETATRYPEDYLAAMPEGACT
jgi:arylsulfotransferase ASST